MRRIRVVGVIAREELEQQREEEAAAAAAAAETETEDPDPAADLDEHAESGETEMLDAEESEGEAEAEEASVDDAIDATEALEKIKIVLESRKDKGLSPAEAQFMNIALEGAYAKANFSRVQVYSPESFTDAKRVHVTRLSMEEVEKNLEAIWAKTKEAIARFWEMLSQWFEKVKAAIRAYFDRAGKLLAAAEKIEGVPKNAELDKPALAKALHIGGQVNPVQAASVLAEATKAALNDQKGVIQMAKSAATGDAAAAAKAVEGTLGKLGQAVGNPKAEGFSAQYVFRSKELPGGLAIVAQWSESVHSAQVGISPFKPAAGEFEGKAIKTLTPDEIKTLAKAIIALKPELEALDGEIKAAKQEASALAGTLDTLYKAGESNPGDKEKVKTLTALAQKVLAEPARSFSGYAAKTLKSLLDVGELSVREYSGNEAQSANSQLPAPAAGKEGGEGNEPPKLAGA